MYAGIATRLIINAGKSLDAVSDQPEPRVTEIISEPTFFVASQALETKVPCLGRYARPDGRGYVHIYQGDPRS